MKTRRRRLTYSLSSLLVLTVVFACSFGVIANEMRRIEAEWRTEQAKATAVDADVATAIVEPLWVRKLAAVFSDVRYCERVVSLHSHRREKPGAYERYTRDFPHLRMVTYESLSGEWQSEGVVYLDQANDAWPLPQP